MGSRFAAYLAYWQERLQNGVAGRASSAAFATFGGDESVRP